MIKRMRRFRRRINYNVIYQSLINMKRRRKKLNKRIIQ